MFQQRRRISHRLFSGYFSRLAAARKARIFGFDMSGNPGVPSSVIRNLLTARAPTCACTQYLDLARAE